MNGAALRDKGFRQLDLASFWDTWPERATAALEQLASSGVPFISDAIREMCGDPARPGQLGAVIRKAARAGLIERVDARPADRPSRRAGLVSVWRGVVT